MELNRHRKKHRMFPVTSSPKGLGYVDMEIISFCQNILEILIKSLHIKNNIFTKNINNVLHVVDTDCVCFHQFL